MDCYEEGFKEGVSTSNGVRKMLVNLTWLKEQTEEFMQSKKNKVSVGEFKGMGILYEYLLKQINQLDLDEKMMERK